ncbi:hypothetical protein PybrP1_001497 [[Pythium] brassicae (nom. inval.)]|nr:hypothetical protein PybrP1_001497 [[Pythium] brassicae (nom. inval.)]
MSSRSFEKISSQALHLAKDAKALAPWAGPGAILAGWLVWPGLTDNFKEEAFGLKPSVPAPVAPAARAAANNSFRSGGKYKFVRGEIGERPTLEED